MADSPNSAGTSLPSPERSESAVEGTTFEGFDPQPLTAPSFDGGGASGTMTELSLLDDVELDVKIELGRAQMYIEDVLSLGVGSVVKLDKLAGDPVDVHINGRLVARGEVLVLNDNLCIRVNDILSPNPELEGSRT